MTNFIAFCLIAGVAYSDGTDCPEMLVLPPCEYEDSESCYWLATEMGNGVGQSFIDNDGFAFGWDGKVEEASQ